LPVLAVAFLIATGFRIERLIRQRIQLGAFRPAQEPAVQQGEKVRARNSISWLTRRRGSPRRATPTPGRSWTSWPSGRDPAAEAVIPGQASVCDD